MPIAWNNPEVKLKIEQTIRPLSISDLAAQAEKCSEMLLTARSVMLNPDSKKKAPVFSADVLAQLCGISKATLDYRIGTLKRLAAERPESSGDAAPDPGDGTAAPAAKDTPLPLGSIASPGAPRRFALEEARRWIKANRPQPPRQPGEEALVITVLNSKGGVAKTSTAFTLAQGLSLRGYDVLFFDADAQASGTTLTGTVPERDIDWTDTVGPFVFGEEADLRYAVSTTYWDGLDIIPSSSLTYEAEMRIGAAAARQEARLWDWFTRGLAPLRRDYDVIIIDTSPALSYLTINAAFAADGLLVPSPPKVLDFAAGAQFWTLFGGTVERMGELVGGPLLDKRWQFVYVLPTLADINAEHYRVVKDWMAETYGSKLFPGEIRASKVAETLSTEFKTVYDVSGRYGGNATAYRNLRDGYDNLAEVIDSTCHAVRLARRKGI